jgi:pyridoxamine 5'-phosphate oxidase
VSTSRADRRVPLDQVELAGMRREYDLVGIVEAELASEPFAQFGLWLAEAAAVVPEPNAMVVATADAAGRPATRTVLLKGFDERGFVFYTNYDSRKARELAVNPAVSLLFPWYPMQRQVIVYGEATRVDRGESAAYFATRPRGAQLGAWASRQSRVVASRDVLAESYRQAEERFADDDVVPLPDFWGGFRVRPDAVEFWQGRADRMHDRLVYRRVDTTWRIERLSP